MILTAHGHSCTEVRSFNMGLKSFRCKTCGEVFNPPIKLILLQKDEDQIPKGFEDVEDCQFCNPEKYYDQEKEV